MRALPPGLAIRPTTAADLADLGRLWNDGEVMGWVGFPDGLQYDEPALGEWLAAIEASADRRHFVVREAELGFCGELFYAVDPDARRAALDIKLVAAAQGRGIGAAGLAWLIDTVFTDEPAVDVVWTEPWPENEAARRLYARCGLRPGPRPADLDPGPSYWALARSDWSVA
jgi:RimJ/RimL family protein N-acetyltransferase